MFRAGQYVIYNNGDTYEIGLIKHIVDDTCAFVWYHEGDTAANTDLRDLHPIMNEHCIVHTSLGGGAYVYYDRGVAALTDIDDMHPIANDYCLSNIIVGGEKLEPSI